MLLRDYAITPDVFDLSSYPSEEVAGLHLNAIREVLITEGLVRDLRAGEWRGIFSKVGRPWHRRAKELVKKLATQGRLVETPPLKPVGPSDDCEWCDEALASHAYQEMAGGVIVTGSVKAAYAGEVLVERIDQLGRAPWWTSRSPSVRLTRSLGDYQRHLGAILRCSNSLQFIDPHLDPMRHGYRDFPSVLASAGGRRPPPLIEVHRVCYEGSGAARRILDVGQFEQSFRAGLATHLAAAGLRVEVYIWDDFHDRYLLSNLAGVSLPNGFDSSSNPTDVTTWNRLGRAERDDIQREFDPASCRHALRGQFSVP